MEIKIAKKEWIFLVFCLLIGILAEEAFFRDTIGISYFVFIIAFYSLLFWRFRKFSFSHQRLGYFILIVIWFLSAGYFLYDTGPFYLFNILVIPALVIFHLTLITAPQKMDWSNLSFVFYAIRRLFEGLHYSATFINRMAGLLKREGKEKQYTVWKKVLIGVAVSIPFLFIILNLLIEADAQFERIINALPELISFNPESIIRTVIVLLYTFGFFGFMQVLMLRKATIILKKDTEKPVLLDGVITLTVLVLLDLVYILFVAVQFKYFFSGTLEVGFTYAEYARRGFFELLFVTLINLTVTTVVITFTKGIQGPLKKLVQIALSILVIASGVILISAIMRMNMYEAAYGFTFTRVLAHSFMIFLIVIFAYTLVKIWLEKLSLIHFYFLASLVYYTGINTINLNEIVVDQNISRYEETGKIDIGYFSSLSGTGLLGLMDLYEKNPDIQGLEELLQEYKENKIYHTGDTWQSINYTRNKVKERLDALVIK